MVSLYRFERPLMFFGIIAAVLLLLATLLSVPIAVTFLQTGLVPRLPTVVLITGLLIMATLCVFAGMILDTVTRGRREVKRLLYLRYPAPGLVATSSGQ